MTDYYSQFKPAEDSDIARRVKERDSLAKQVANATKRCENERDSAKRLRRHIDSLKERAGESLEGNQNSYEKYKRDITNSAQELNTSEALVSQLANEFLPGKQSAMRDASLNLSNSLQRHLIESRHIVDLEIDLLLCQCLTIIGNFMDAFRRIYGDFDVGFIANNETYYPGPWTAEEIGNLRRRLGMDAPPQAEPTAVEPTPDTPEAEPVESGPAQAITILGGAI